MRRNIKRTLTIVVETCGGLGCIGNNNEDGEVVSASKTGHKETGIRIRERGELTFHIKSTASLLRAGQIRP
jgi:hypothetical protein